MIGNNSCGTHSLLAGKTVDNVSTSCAFCSYDGAQMTVEAVPSDRELDSVIAQGGRRGDILLQAEDHSESIW